MKMKMTEKVVEVPEEQRKKEIKSILDGQYPEEAIVVLGENRGQLFARIPKIVEKRLNLVKGSKLLFKVYNENKKSKLEVSVYESKE